MRALAAHVPTDREDLLDTAGTGGGRSTFNVSTTAALIAAGAGCAVAKHGNRSATSRSGSADLLEALGRAHRPRPRGGRRRASRRPGFGFMFAPAHHQATRFVIPVRRELAVRTIFNLLGPLTNPAGARRQLIGVSDPAFLETIAGALAQTGRRSRAGRRGRGRPRRDLERRADEGGRGQRRGDPPLHADAGARSAVESARDLAAGAVSRAERPQENAAGHARDPRGRGAGRRRRAAR